MPSKPKKTNAPKFEVLEKLGSGLYADVVRAQDKALGRFVALKIMKEEFETSTFAVEHGRIMAKLPKHKNVVQIFGIEEIDYNGNVKQAVVMEWIEGQSIASALSGPRFGVPQTKKLIEGIVAGIEFMHSHDVFHGDLHPGNIVIGPDGEPVIIDASVQKRGTLSQMHADMDESVFGLDLDSLKHVVFRCLSHSKIAPSLMLTTMDTVDQQVGISEIGEVVKADSFWKSNGSNSASKPHFSISSGQELTIQYLENSQLPSLKEYCFSSATRLVDSINDTNEYPLDADVSKEEYSRRVEDYESVAFELANTIGYVSGWAENSDHDRIVIDSIQLVAEGVGRYYMKGMFKPVWKNLRQYPLVLLFYSCLFACYRNERFGLMRKLLLEVELVTEDHAATFFLSTRYYTGEFRQDWNSVLETRQYTPVDDRISEMLLEYLPSFCGSGTLSNQVFDELQCFLSSVSLNRQGVQDYLNPEKDWGVPGCYLWRHQRRTRSHEDPCDKLISRIERDQSKWPPLKAGFFDGDPNVAVKTMRYAKTVHGHMRSHLRIF